MIGITTRGEYTKTIRKLKHMLTNQDVASVLDKYGRIGVDRLSKATPVRTGLTADSWKYKVTKFADDTYKLEFSNTNQNDNIPIVVLLRYGHVTSTGGWVEGHDFVAPIIDELTKEIQNEF